MNEENTHRRIVWRAFGTATIAALVAWSGSADADVLEFKADGSVVLHGKPVTVDLDLDAIPAGLSEAHIPYLDIARRAADKHDVPLGLLLALMEAESAFDPTAVSPAGAQGIMQLIPKTAERFGVVDAFDPEQAVPGGAAYLAFLLDRYDGDPALALAGYNAGEGAVDRYSGVPPYAETEEYVARVRRRLGLDEEPVRKSAASALVVFGATSPVVIGDEAVDAAQ